METITIRLPKGMREALHVLSKAQNRSLNGQVVEELRKALHRSPKPIPQNTIEKEEK